MDVFLENVQTALTPPLLIQGDQHDYNHDGNFFLEIILHCLFVCLLRLFAHCLSLVDKVEK